MASQPSGQQWPINTFRLTLGDIQLTYSDGEVALTMPQTLHVRTLSGTPSHEDATASAPPKRSRQRGASKRPRGRPRNGAGAGAPVPTPALQPS